MFRIGDFSRLTQVTVKALRHYDALGLLKPAHIDPDSGYRYYTADQLPRLNRVLALKDLGFSLEQIGQLLDAELSSDQLRQMLELRRAEVRAQITDEQTRLARIEARLDLIKRGTASIRYDVVLKRIEEQPVASLRDTLPARHAIIGLFRELFLFQRQHALAYSSPTVLWHEAEFHDEEVDAEATIRTEDLIPSGGRVVGRVLPAVESMACVVHEGPPETASLACESLLNWIEANGCELAGPERGVLLQRGTPDGHGWVMEMQYPVAVPADGL
ncbi:MAG TPA: MerR family transcriptional regulator [Nitrolancea sp.]